MHTTPIIDSTSKCEPASEPLLDAGSIAIPSWLQEDEVYVPSRDREGFLRRNGLKFTSLLAQVKMQRGGTDTTSSTVDHILGTVDPALRLLGVIALIICTASARNMFFVYMMMAVVLTLLAFRKAEMIVDIIKPALVAAAFSALIMLPAIFLGQPTALVRISLKVFLSVSLLVSLSRSVAWNELIAGLRFYHVPSLFVFVFDITIKYIVLLGEVAGNVLDALTLRSVGRNPHKTGSASNVMGVTFLKAHDYGAEMYQAMECRGFVGEYEICQHRVMDRAGIIYLLAIAVAVACFLYLEGVF